MADGLDTVGSGRTLARRLATGRRAAADSGTPHDRRAGRALRLLVWFWLGVLATGLTGGAALEWLGPPGPLPGGMAGAHAGAVATADTGAAASAPGAAVADGTAAPAPPPPADAHDAAPASVPTAPVTTALAPTASLAPPEPVATASAPPPAEPAAMMAVARPDGPIPLPDPALLEPAPDLPGAMLPRIGPGGRMPRVAYAAGALPANGQPRVALLLGGIGISEPETDVAIRSTPAAVSLAITPYAVKTDRVLEAARLAGHETLVSIPMEPQGFPLNDAGNRSLLTGNSPAQNQQRLIWALSRFTGYVGATSALAGGLRGERFAGSPEQMAPVLSDLASRGLLFVDARPGAAVPARVGGRSVDVLIDQQPTRADVEARLAELEHLARDRGTAVGLVMEPRPVTVDRVAAWARTVPTRGVVLVPVSALVPPPASAAPRAQAASATTTPPAVVQGPGKTQR